MQKITLQTTPQDILEEIAKLREQKGKEKETIALINQSLELGHGWIINLLWEEALTYQHLVMNENSKPRGLSDPKARKIALLNMEKTMMEAKFYIEKYNLKQWYSRMHRFLGRLYDYKGEFKKAVGQYQKAIKFVKNDFEYKRAIPREMELKAFLAYSTLMSGNHKKSLEMSRLIYESFDNSESGKLLKKKDYFTWAVWKTGIPIRTINALVDKKINFDKDLMLKWLSEAEKDLNSRLGKKFDFGYRKEEIAAIKNLLS